MSNRIDDWFDRLICIAHYKNPKACPRITASKKQVARASDNLYNLLLEVLGNTDLAIPHDENNKVDLTWLRIHLGKQNSALNNIFGKGDEADD